MNKPVYCGWSVTADDLLKEHGGGFSGGDYALVIDFHPGSLNHIGLVEIEAIHVYTYGNDSGALWSPMMLELREMYNHEFDEPFLPDWKRGILARLELPPTPKKIVEFLYVQGGSWKWGVNGYTNAAFIYDDAREYFQRAFNTDQDDSK